MLKDAKHILSRLLQRRFEPQWNFFDSTRMIWRLLKSSKCMILHFVLLKMLNTFASVLANGISAMFRINSSSSGNQKKISGRPLWTSIVKFTVSILLFLPWIVKKDLPYLLNIDFFCSFVLRIYSFHQVIKRQYVFLCDILRLGVPRTVCVKGLTTNSRLKRRRRRNYVSTSLFPV